MKADCQSGPCPASPLRPAAAFTLLELLVGMVIMCSLVVVLGSILSFTSKAWIQNKAGIERLQNVRISTDFIGKELQAALLPVDRTSTNSLQFVVNPPGVDATAYGIRDSIFWQTPSSVNDNLGDVAEIGYFVKWDESRPGNPRPQLCRFFLPAADTNYGLAAAGGSQFIYTRPDAWVTSAMLANVAPADKTSGYRGLFAENVAGLWVRCLDAYGEPIDKDFFDSSLVSGQTHRFDSRLGYRDSKNLASPGYQPSGGGPTQPLAALPAAVDLGFVILDANSAAKITPAIRDAMTALAKSSTNARAFVDSAQASPSLVPVRTGLRYYQTRIYLENAK